MWSPWTHSTNVNGPVPEALVLASGPSRTVPIAHVELLEEVEHRRSRLFGLQDDRVLVGCVDGREPGALGGEVAVTGFRVLDADEVPLDVVAGELAAGVPGHALAQVELDLLVVGRDVPALGEHGQRLELVVVGDQSVVGEPGALVRCAAAHDRIESNDVGRDADAQACRQTWAGQPPRLPAWAC